jgi:hypothetical protein
MHHLRGGSGDDYFERGTHGQDMPEDDDAEDVTNLEADNVEEVMEQRRADPATVEFLREQMGSRKGRPSTKDVRPDQSLGEPELTEEQKEEDQKIYQQKRDKIISNNREAAKTKAAKKIDRESRVAAAMRRVRNAKRREERAGKKTYDEEGTGSQDFDQRMEKFDDMWPSEGSLTHGDPRLDKHARTMWASGGLRPGTDLEDMRQEVTRRYPRAFPNEG